MTSMPSFSVAPKPAFRRFADWLNKTGNSIAAKFDSVYVLNCFSPMLYMPLISRSSQRLADDALMYR
jgi:hypothetical protein